MEGSGDNIYSPLCGGLYNGKDDSLAPWSGTDPGSKMNCSTWSKEKYDWVFPGGQYNEEFNK